MLLRQEIGQALEREVTDPGIGFVTVTNVETVPDLSRARVWVSVIGSEEKRKETLAALRRAMPFIRHGLGTKLSLRRIPELDVRLDDSIERGTRVLKIINDLEAGQIPDLPDTNAESLPNPVPRLRLEGDTLDDLPPIPAPEEPLRPGPRHRRRGDRPGGGSGGHEGNRTGKPDARRRPR